MLMNENPSVKSAQRIVRIPRFITEIIRIGTNLRNVFLFSTVLHKIDTLQFYGPFLCVLDPFVNVTKKYKNSSF